jgi:putative inorganic carbon (HCO3(-)) transporter
MNKGVTVPTLTASTAALPNLDTIIRGLLYVYIFSLPFEGLLFVERNGFIILVVLLLLWCAVNQRHFFTRTPIDLPLLAFVFWVAFTIPFSMFPSYSFKEFGKLLQQGLIYYVVVYFFNDGPHRIRLLSLLVGVLILVSAYGVTQFDIHDRQAMVSFLSAEVWLTTYLVMFIPLCIALALCEKRPWSKALYVGVSVLAAACLLLTQSRAGQVAFICELWVLAWLIRRRTMLVVASMFSLALVVSAVFVVKVGTTAQGVPIVGPQTIVPIRTGLSSVVHRLDIWAFSLSQIAMHPIVGIGYGKDNFKLVYGDTPEEVPPGHSPIRNQGTHNLFLYLALHVGLPGLMLFLWLAARIVRTDLAAFRRVTDPVSQAVLLGAVASVIGMGVRLMFDQMFVGTLAIQFWILVAIAMVARRAVDGVTQTPAWR